MSDIKTGVIDAYEETALIGLAAIKEYLAYRGQNAEYFKRARVGAVPVTAFSRVLATKANMDSLELQRRRFETKP